MSRRRLAAVCAVVTTAALSAAASASAVTWTAIPSGTTSTITNVEYQSPTRFWFTTANGEIFTRQGDGSFSRRYGPSSIPLTDIEFQRSGNIGLAVGNGGQVLRSADAGATWTNVNPAGTPIPVSKKGTTFPDCSASAPLGDVHAVRFAGNSRVWIMGEGAQIAKSEPATAANVGGTGTWVDANRSGTNTCKIQTAYADGISDAFFPAANPDVGYFCTAYFGELFFTSNDLASTAAKKPADCGNGYTNDRRMTGDQVNTSRMWAVEPGGPNGSYTSYTTDGWASSHSFVISDENGFLNQTPYDVANSGGTVMSAGDAGMILMSTDGVSFTHVPAGGAQATAAWRAVSVASATQAAVAGQGGQLAITGDANVLPAPPATTSGGTTGSFAMPTTAPAPLTPVAASSPASTSTGGTVITIYRLVKVSGHSGRYVPVRIKAKGKRTIRIALYPKGKKRAISTLTVRFKRKGVRLAKVPLPATAKLGRYTVVVKVYKGRNRTGRSVRQAIVVA
jgi:photosystem II stability/assembly factor-like uncharacterized protein